MEIKDLERPEVRDAIIKLASLLKEAQSNAVTRFDETVPVLSQPTQQKISGSGISGTAQTAQESVPAMVDQAAPPQSGMAYAAPNGEEVAPEQMQTSPMTPAQEGIMAAQEFLSPIMEAAMNGDPNAQLIIAQAAGSIARNIAEASSVAPAPAPEIAPAQETAPAPEVTQATAPAPAIATAPGVAPNAEGAVVVGPDGNPVLVAPSNPEEQIANQIVPETKAAPEGKKGSEAPVKEDSGKETKSKSEKSGGTKDGENNKDFKKMAAIRTLIELAKSKK